jgi:AcrR family transcriptional regulator
LYHHFRDKRAVFAAVYEILRREISSKVMAAGTDESDLWARFRRGCSAYLDACLDPAVQRVVSLESWSVLGREAMSEMNSARGSGMVSKGMIQMGIEEAIDGGFIDEQPSQPLAEIIGGALGAAGIAIARSENKEVVRRDLGRAVDWLLGRLRNRVEPNPRTSQSRRRT